MMHELANFFFGLTHVPIAFFTDTPTWQRWESHCFRMLNEIFQRFRSAMKKSCGIPPTSRVFAITCSMGRCGERW